MNKYIYIVIGILILALGVGEYFLYNRPVEGLTLGLSVFTISQGGTNNNSYSKSLVWFDGSKIASTSTSPLTVGSITSTTTATSTFQGGLDTVTGGIRNRILTSCTGINALNADSNGVIVCGAVQASSFPFTPATNYAVNVNATTGIPWFQNGLQASSTSHLVNFDFISATGTNLAMTGSTTLSDFAANNFVGLSGTTTNFFATLASTTALNTLAATSSKNFFTNLIQATLGLFTSATTTNLGINSETFTDLTGTGLSNSSGVLTNSGVISNSCSLGVSCSGTNPSTFTGVLSDWKKVVGNLFAITPSTTPMGIIVGASSTIDQLSIRLSTTTSATTTNLGINSETFVDLTGTGLSNSNNVLTNSGVISGSCSLGVSCTGTNPLTVTGTSPDWNKSSDLLAITPTTTIGILIYSSSTMTDLNVTRSTTTNATTTSFFASIASTSKLFANNATTTFFGITSAATGCLQSTNGVITSTGSSCGGSSVNTSKWATSTGAFSSITPNGGTSVGVGIGTTTPFAALQAATSTGKNLALTDPNAGLNLKHWLFSSLGGSLYIGSTTESGATSTVSSLELKPTGTGLFVGTSTNTGATGLAMVGTGYWTGLTASAGLQTGILCLSASNEIINESVACVASSRRFKEKILPLTSGLDELLKLKPVSFYFKPEYNGGLQSNPNFSGEQVGFIAEDVIEIDPRLATVEKDGVTPHGVRYEQMTALLVKSIQELNAKFDKKFYILAGFFILYVIYNEVDKRRRWSKEEKRK